MRGTPERRGSVRRSSGRPSTGATCRRGPATSMRPGSTTSSEPVPSRSQARRCRRFGLQPGVGATATTPKRPLRTLEGSESRSPSTGHARDVALAVLAEAGRGAGAGDDPADVGDAAGALDEVAHRLLGADREDREQAATALAGLVQPAAQRVAAGHGEQAGDGQHAEHPRPDAGALEDQAGEGQDDRRADVAAHQAAPLLGALAEHAGVPGAGGADARSGPAPSRPARGPTGWCRCPRTRRRSRRARPAGRRPRGRAGPTRPRRARTSSASSWPRATLPGCPGPSSSQIRMKPGAVGSGSTNGAGSACGPAPAACRCRRRRRRHRLRPPVGAWPGSRRCRSGRSCPRARCRSRVRPCSERPATLRSRPGRPTSLVARAGQWSPVVRRPRKHTPQARSHLARPLPPPLARRPPWRRIGFSTTLDACARARLRADRT